MSQTYGGFDGRLDDVDAFGLGIARLEDLDGDGTPELAAGALGTDDGASSAGALWILFMDGRGLQASAEYRNAGTNPESYRSRGNYAGTPVHGGTLELSLDVASTGHRYGTIVGYLGAATTDLGDGRYLLVDTSHPAGEILRLPLRPAPVEYSITVPEDLSLCGVTISTQGMHLVPAEERPWSIQLTPYVWFMGIEGDGEINGMDFDFERDFEDLVDQIDFAASILGLGRYGRWVFSLQYDYASLSNDELEVPGEFETTLNLIEAGVGYTVDGWSEGQRFDLLVGVRNLDLDNELTIDRVGMFEDDVSLTDPMFFVRPTLPLFPSKVDGLILNPTFGVGGGGDSDFVYELAPQIQYSLNERFDVRFGYRRVGYRFEDGDDELNVDFAGLILGVGINI